MGAVSSIECCRKKINEDTFFLDNFNSVNALPVLPKNSSIPTSRIDTNAIKVKFAKGEHINPFQRQSNTIQSYSVSSFPSSSKKEELIRFSHPLTRKMHNNIEIIHEQYSNENLTSIKNYLSENGLITQEMKDSTVNLIINSSVYYRIKANVVFFEYERKNDKITLNEKDKYIIIIKGNIALNLNNSYDELTFGKGTFINTKILKATNKKIVIKAGSKHIYLFTLMCEKYKAIINDFNEKQSEERYLILKNIPLFRNVDKKTLLYISKETKRVQYKERTMIIKEDNIPDSLYILIDGFILCSKCDEIVCKIATTNHLIGDINLLNQNYSFYSYSAEKDTIVFIIQYNHIITSFKNQTNFKRKIIMGMFAYAVKNCSLLNKYYSSNNIESLYFLFKLKYYNHDIVINRKQNKIVLILSGDLYHKETVKTPIGAVGKIVKDSLINNNVQIFTNECLVLECQWENIIQNTKSYIAKSYSLYEIINIIRSNLEKNFKIKKNLSEMKLYRISEACKIKQFQSEQEILSNGPISDIMYFILSGTVIEMVDGIQIRTLNENDSFGDIINDQDAYEITTSYIAKTKVTCLYIYKEVYDNIISANFLKHFKKMFTETNTAKAEDNKILLENLYYLRDLGQGSYGRVYLVTDNKKLFAMKTAEIQALATTPKTAQYYINEKSIMLNLNFSFIVKLYHTYKTREYIFFLLEYVQGISLRNYFDLTNRNLRNLMEVQFFGGILSLILDYLETKRIIHRDIKPDNILINQNGYLKTIDFGIAKDLTGKNYTSSIIGTCKYMAPEITLGKAYSFAVDYWSMGVVLYECFYGKVPFGLGIKDPIKIYKEINEKNPILPSDVKNEKFNDFLKQLLNKNPKKRLSCLEKIKKHPFYNEFNFDKLNNMEIEPPYKPKEEESNMPSNVNLKVLESENMCLFTEYMKNNIFCSSSELDKLVNEAETDLFGDF